ncbi:outer membrane protein assembly factor BamE [Litorilituus lipolyticus]|uniref:Lipoprotein n=1 Tax=Litorilituus lipolyticus TaxID=2491017 RepID=A0A502KU87_9GAMM|nr:outer membrane protein assembly factor BamE [Litorilituus lipolyticus]TPH15102.1 hypothetical protein EPA86_09800 [Litorilituus lipolyticus]
MKALKNTLIASSLVITSSALTGCGSTAESSADLATNYPGFSEGAKVYSIVNLHPDSPKNRLYAMNYQLPRVLPICSEFIIQDIATKRIELTYKGMDYYYDWDKYTRSAGQSLAENFNLFFSESCDEAKAKVKQLSQLDQDGIKKGKPLVGMSKEGILLAMGRPPIHATPDLEGNSWTYWINKWARNIIEFDENGKVKEIVK